MFYEAIKEITRTKYNNSIYKQFGGKFCDLCRNYEQRDVDIRDRQLNKLKEIANKLDVPIGFVVSILKYEEVEELGETRRASEGASGDTEKAV